MAVFDLTIEVIDAPMLYNRAWFLARFILTKLAKVTYVIRPIFIDNPV